jgi:glutamate N-acetyltransferase / amino-acid N-acetyltransferase
MSLRCNGFRFGAAAAGIKKQSGALDVGLLACESVASAAAIFTQNRVKAAPVRLSQALLRKAGGRAQAIVVNSGNANACTGAAGTRDARQMAAAAAAAIGADAGQVLVASTGVIGVPLPMERVAAGIGAAAESLSADGFDAFAHAILTTDKRAKAAGRTVTIGGSKVTLIGCTKGAGMIAPNMATTLTFVATDARVAPRGLDAAIRAAVAPTFNAITVDGDTSTNDTLALLASGRAGKGKSGLAGADARRFTEALTDLLDELARALIGDGEGVHHVVRVCVRGARSDAAARKVAQRIANSPLVKTAIAGGDPNWGRILCAVGNAGVPIRPERIDLTLDDVAIARAGAAAPDFVEARAAEVMQRPTYDLVVDLHDGKAEARYLACDLSHGYVEINADYRT